MEEQSDEYVNRLVETTPESASLYLRRWIVAALESKSKGDSQQYMILLKELDVIFEDPALLRLFSQCVSFLDPKHHEALLLQLLGTSLWSCSSSIGDAILEFVIHLVAANSGTLHQCLEMIVRNFLPPCCGIPAFMGVSRSSSVVGVAAIMKAREQRQEQMMRKQEITDKIHETLCRLMEMVPTAPARIQPIILERMPHKVVEKEFQCLYVENIFRLAISKPGAALRNQLLAFVVERLVAIDVEIRWEDILKQEEDESSRGKVYLFHMDLDDDSDEECVPSTHLANEKSTPGSEVARQHGLILPRREGVPTLDEMADKMDALMQMSFQHLQKRVESGEMEQVFETLLHSFLSAVLETHKSKFTQFLLFYLGSLSPDKCGSSFSRSLCEIITSPSRSSEIRMSASAYLASYLARAKYLPLSVITTSLTRVTSWCVEYIESEDRKRRMSPLPSDSRFALLSLQDSSSHKQSPHAVFYCVCQAVFYVLCYRFTVLMSDSKSEALLRSLPLHKLIAHPLNPIAACLESVAVEFERQARAFKVVDVRPIRERHLSSFNIPFTHFGGEKGLDTFFPFDPYLLRQSNRFIKPIYLKWVQPSIEEQSEEESDSARDRDLTENETNEESLFGDEDDDGYPGTENTGTETGAGESSSDEDLDNVAERMGSSYSDFSDMGGTTPVTRFLSPKGLPIRKVASPAGSQGTTGFEPRSVEMGSYTSDEMAASLKAVRMSGASPKLPPRLPPRLAKKFSD